MWLKRKEYFPDEMCPRMTNVEAVDCASTVPALGHIGGDPEEKTGKGQQYARRLRLARFFSVFSGLEKARRVPNQRLLSLWSVGKDNQAVVKRRRCRKCGRHCGEF
jgi:hypothetical protein